MRINAQMSNDDRIARSSVVICPAWEFECTRRQVFTKTHMCPVLVFFMSHLFSVWTVCSALLCLCA